MESTEASERASIAAHMSWAKTPNKAARTLAARQARWLKYIERAAELAPDGADEADILERAEHLRMADMKRMALKSAQVRKARAA